jgi:transposase
MIRPSYVPERPVRELRMLTRQRREKIRDVAREKNRLQKILEQGHVKLRGVMSDLFGASGQAILQAMILDQQTDPVKLAGMAKGGLQKKKEEIIAALQGHRLPPTQRLLLKQGMEHLALLAPQIEGLYHQIEEKIRLEGWKVPYRNLQSIPGLKETEASEFLAEVGPQATAFPQCGASERGVGSVPEMTRERQATQRTHDEG